MSIIRKNETTYDISWICVLYLFDDLFYEIENRLTPRLADNNCTEVGEGRRKLVPRAVLTNRKTFTVRTDNVYIILTTGSLN